MASAGAANCSAIIPPEHVVSPSSSQPLAADSRAVNSPSSRSVLSNQSRVDVHGTSEGCYLVTMGLCARVRAKNAQVAAAVAADAAAGVATESGHSEAARIGSLYISAVPAQKHSQYLDHKSREPQRQQQQQTPQSPQLASPLRGVQAHVPQPPPPSFCTIHLENSHAYGADSAATEAVIGAVARAAAAEVSLPPAEISADNSSLSGDSPQRPDGPSREKEARGVVGVDLPDLKNIPLAIRVPPYGEHLLYELKQLRHFWRVDLRQRDWRQVFVCSYFPNAIDPAFLTLLRIFCCITVLVLECFASIQGYREVGKAQMLYFTNWNSLLVAAGFVSLTITSVIACMSFAAPLRQRSGSTSDPQHDQQHRRRVQLPQEQQHHQRQKQQKQAQFLMNPVEETSSTYSLNCSQSNFPNTNSRESSTCSLGFSALEFVAVDGRHPRPTYSSSKAALLPWLVLQRQHLLQQQRQPRNSRVLCLVLEGYRDLMADSRYCVEGILLAPNPSNRSVSRTSSGVGETGPRLHFCRKRITDSQRGSSCSPRVSMPSHTLTACSSGAADSGPTCSTGSRSAGERPGLSGVDGTSIEPAEQEPGAIASAAATPAATAKRGASTAATPVDVPWFVKVTWIVHNLQLVASLGVAAVFFSLFKAEDVQFPGSWVTVWKHAVLVLLTLLHASLLSRIPCPMRHMGYTIILFFCYLALQLCVFIFKVPNGQGGIGYVYKVFCLSEPLKAMIVLVSIFVCCFLMHLFLWSISRKRCLYVDPPPSVSVTALQLKRSIRYAAAAAAAAAAAEQMASESSAAAANAETLPKESLIRLSLQQHPCCSEQASTGNPDGRQSGSSTGRDGHKPDDNRGQQQVQPQ